MLFAYGEKLQCSVLLCGMLPFLSFLFGAVMKGERQRWGQVEDRAVKAVPEAVCLSRQCDCPPDHAAGG